MWLGLTPGPFHFLVLVFALAAGFAAFAAGFFTAVLFGAALAFTGFVVAFWDGSGSALAAGFAGASALGLALSSSS